MNEALILEKLDALSDEVRSLKKDVLQELRRDLEPVLESTRPAAVGFLQDVENGQAKERLLKLSSTLLASVEELSEAVRCVSSEDGEKSTAFPKSVQFLTDVESEFHIDELAILMRKAITNLDTMGEGLDMLKAGVEFRDEMAPVLRLMYPKIVRFLNSLHEGEFQAEKLGDLLHTVLLNIHTLSDLLNMIQPFTELVKEVGVLMKETDIINGMNIWLDSLQQESGLVRLAGTSMAALRKLDCSEEQVNEICRAIENLDLSSAEPVGLMGMVKQMNDPQVKEAIGFIFMILQTIGACLHACRMNGEKQKI